MTDRIDVVGIGNALVDVLSHETDELPRRARPRAGRDAAHRRRRAPRQLYAAMGPAIEISGGSAANTMVGVASFGGRAAFVGRVADDQLGDGLRPRHPRRRRRLRAPRPRPAARPPAAA